MSGIDFKRSFYIASMFGCLVGSAMSSIQYWFGYPLAPVTIVLVYVGAICGILWIRREMHLQGKPINASL